MKRIDLGIAHHQPKTLPSSAAVCIGIIALVVMFIYWLGGLSFWHS